MSLKLAMLKDALVIAYAEVYLVSGWCKKSDNAKKATVKIGFLRRLMLRPLIR